MKQLEAQLGVDLFERVSHGLLPTTAGQRLYERARPLLLELESLGDELDAGPIRGRVSLGVSPSLGAVWASGLVQIIRHELPELELRVVSMLSGALGAAVASGALDVGLLYAPTLGSGLVESDLWEENTYLIVAATSEICAQRSVSLRRALALPLVLPSSRYGLRDLLEKEARQAGMELRVEVEVDSVQLALALVRRNVGAMFLTERALFDLDRSALRAVAVRSPRLKRTATLVSVESSLRRQATRAVWDLCEKSALARRVLRE